MHHGNKIRGADEKRHVGLFFVCFFKLKMSFADE